MRNSGKQALLFAANLSLPAFQVIAVNANLGCGHCRDRVTQIISKMAGSKKFTIDICMKQVIVRGEVRISIYKTGRKDAEQKKIEKKSIVSCVLEFLVRLFGFVRTISHCWSEESVELVTAA